MARARITDQTDRDDDPIDAAFEDRSAQVQDEADELEQFKSAFGQDSDTATFHCKLYLVPQNSSKRPYLMTISKGDLENVNEIVLQRYGSGDYEARLMKIENGRTSIAKRITFSVIAPKTVAPQMPAQNDTALVTAVSQLGEIVRDMQRAQTVRTIESRPPMSAADIATLVTAGAAAFTTLKTAFATPQSTINPLEVVTSVIDLVKSSQNEGREKGLIDLVSDIITSDALPKLIENIQIAPRTATPAPPRPQLQSPQSQMQPQTQPQPQPQAQPQTPPPPPLRDTAPDTALPTVAALQPLLARMVTRAAKGSDPALYADWLLDQEELTPLLPLLAQPNIISQLIEYEPAVAAHVKWFVDLLAYLTSEPEPDDEAESKSLTGENVSQSTAPEREL